MKLMDWIRTWGRRAAAEIIHREERLSNDRLTSQENHRELEEVREKLERVKRQHEMIVKRRTDH